MDLQEFLVIIVVLLGIYYYFLLEAFLLDWISQGLEEAKLMVRCCWNPFSVAGTVIKILWRQLSCPKNTKVA